MRDSSADSLLAPVDPGDRLDALDALRGFALLGIALVNVEFFTRPLQDINAAGIEPDARGADYAIELLIYFFAQGKFWTLFALLFGMGFAVMADRARRAGRPFVVAYLRRSLALLAIGAVHAVMVWSGDILVTYAIGALLLLLARQLRRAWLRGKAFAGNEAEPPPMAASALLAWGTAFYIGPLLLILVAGMVGSLLGGLPATARGQAERAARVAAEAQQRADAVVAYSHGTFSEAVAQRVEDTLWQLGSLPLAIFWVVGLFLLGAAVVRSGVLHHLHAQPRWLRNARNAGLVIGFAAMAASTALGTETPGDDLDFAQAAQVTLFVFASLVLALAYAAALSLALQGPMGNRLQAWLGPVGRMALSHYLLQSVVGTVVFYGYGLGLWGQVDRVGQVMGVLAVFALQACVSRIWLQRFRHGPAEWAWRCITYWRVLPFRF